MVLQIDRLSDEAILSLRVAIIQAANIQGGEKVDLFVREGEGYYPGRLNRNKKVSQKHLRLLVEGISGVSEVYEVNLFAQ